MRLERPGFVALERDLANQHSILVLKGSFIRLPASSCLPPRDFILSQAQRTLFNETETFLFSGRQSR